nr:GAF domain-containing protein [Nesterenkonia sp. NBAIMH1]
MDRITRLAQEIFGVPMVSVNLIDRDRQWSKSSVGLDITDIPREDAFCSTTIHQTDSLIIEDLQRDGPFRESQYVTDDPNLRFYAGHPLEAPGGEHVGALCLLDTEPRHLSEEDRRLFRELARWVQIELAHKQELDHAAVVPQRASAPGSSPQLFAPRCAPPRSVRC